MYAARSRGVRLQERHVNDGPSKYLYFSAVAGVAGPVANQYQTDYLVLPKSYS